MACAASLHPLSSSSRALFPPLCRQSTIPAIFHRLRNFSSTSRLVSTMNRLSPVRAQAKRGFSVKEDEVASAADVEFEIPLKIVEYPDPILRAKNKRIDSFDDNLKNLVDEMFDRPETVKIDARDIKGARFTVSLSGLPARVFQHEFDHLQGVLFFDRMSEGVLETICAQLQALEKKYEDRTGLPSPERVETRRRMKAATGFGKSQLV
ncbi:hypothetical protein C1H46_016348 [Malus baccata]|uniref:Peptide deformylase n=1 Tax=Malus baccata TaxID=106549 RepID=A0A540MH97_MALBA|nr:hypothetical protein C1H46_016348 [Malus baccata]